jgi:hypothetical protein
MSIGVLQDYILNVKFGGVEIPLNPASINACTFVQDVNKFLPEFRLSMVDETGMFTNAIPFDSKMSRITCELSRVMDDKDIYVHNFTIFRRTPRTNGLVTDYDIRGMLTVDSMFERQYSRAFNQSIKDTLLQIGDELGVDGVLVSSSLNTKKLLIQANWTNAVFLNYLKNNLDGANGQGNFRCFIKVKQNQTQMIFKSVEELVSGPITHKFIISDQDYFDHTPVYKYEIMDNYKILGVDGCYQQPSLYFDYAKGTWVEKNLTVADLTSLSEYLAIDGNDDKSGQLLPNYGRNTEFTTDFHGVTKSEFETRVNDLVKMWIIGPGQLTVSAGDVVRVLFPQGTESGNLFSYQYSGNWLVERVVHTFDDMFIGKYLLTRPGLDTAKSTTLMKAPKTRK